MRKSVIVMLSMITIGTLALSGCQSGARAGQNPNAKATQQEEGTSVTEEAAPSDEEVLAESPEAETAAAQAEPAETDVAKGEDAPAAVYMTTDISPNGLMAVYQALGWEPDGKVAVKLSTGEPPASNYLDPELIKDLVQHVDGTIVECNTAYGGSRSETNYALSGSRGSWLYRHCGLPDIGRGRLHVHSGRGRHTANRKFCRSPFRRLQLLCSIIPF